MWAVRGARVFGRASRRTCSGWEPAVGMGERTAATDQLPANRVAAPPVSVNHLDWPRLVSVGGPGAARLRPGVTPDVLRLGAGGGDGGADRWH
ncbi:hypothetical protein GCM10029976_073730 [Kribbella albertanoniae]